jgi:hypothetical protein
MKNENKNPFEIQVLPISKRCQIINENLRLRLDTILPAIMQEARFDMWLVLCLEDNFDPIFETMIPMDTWCPILQMLVFFRRPDGSVERINLSRTKMHDLYDVPYTVQMPDFQWGWLREVIEARDPKRIAINQAEVAWVGDGLSASLKEKLIETLPEKYVERLEPGEVLCRRWAETLTERELELYPHVVSVTHAILREVYSRKTIVPGVTTIQDLVWAYWQKAADLGMDISFKPSFMLRRREKNIQIYGQDDQTIRQGDFVFCDVGIKYLRLITDTKEWAYILPDEETDVPESFKALLAESNRLQDIYTGEFIQGRTGNQILQSTLKKAREAGMNNPRVYSHSCGLFLHEPGPLIGHPFEQENYPGRGDVPLNYNSTFVAELSVDGVIPEWDNDVVRMSTEEQIMFTRAGVKFIDGRQTAFYLV